MTSTKLTQPGESRAKKYGALHLIANLTVDGGCAINVHQGPERIDALSGLRFDNRLDASDVYRDIRDAALAGMPIEDIAELVRRRLVAIRGRIDGRDGMDARVAELDRMLDRVERLAFTSDLSDGYADLNRLADSIHGPVF
ncbi:hypothetical protein [Verrucosispora sp. WMMC514]|uniref:hypothetical protein n=1 Tax=Verrucosispora sp. WMMC514 TaxID=3015156 RepID=UPI00248B61E9|nr:hypothetical protein [Verrucosispora sp. WMMC514]WBB94119.1 hypothetical protein O7597_14820 [Verrucosispora sp. WMMC514]